MFKFIPWIAVAFLSVMIPATAATEAVETTQITARIEQLQLALDKDIAQLKTAKGEIRSLTEYRIMNRIKDLRSQIGMMVNQSAADQADLTPLIMEQLQFNAQVQAYLTSSIEGLEQTLGQVDDKSTIHDISELEADRDQFYEARLETINWAEKVGMDVSSDRAALTETLIYRGHRLESMVSFLQQQWKKKQKTKIRSSKRQIN